LLRWRRVKLVELLNGDRATFTGPFLTQADFGTADLSSLKLVALFVP